MNHLPADITILNIVRKNQRYATYRAVYRGRQVFVKQAVRVSLAAGIRRELWGLQVFEDLAMYNHLPFEVPKILHSGSDFVVTKWVEGQPLDFDPAVADFDDNVAFLAGSLARLDTLTRLANPMRSRFDVPLRPRQSLPDSLESRLGALSYRQYFEQTLIKACLDMVRLNLGSLEARLTHGDFTPNNIVAYKSKRTLVDFESTNLLWPRFYDVVNLTINRLITQPETSAGCQRLVKLYLGQIAGTVNKAGLAQMNTIAMVRLLSMIIEIMSPPSVYHNTHYTMNDELADRLNIYMVAVLAGTNYFEV